MTEVWAKANPKIHFSVMHPGWADTPGIIQNIAKYARFNVLISFGTVVMLVWHNDFVSFTF